MNTSEASRRTVNELIDRYEREGMSALEARTRKDYTRHFVKLRAAFGTKIAANLIATDFAEFLHVPAGVKGGINRNRIFSVLSSVFAKAVEWGWLPYNACLYVPRNPSKPPERKLTDQEYEGVRKLAAPPMRTAMDLVMLTRQTQGNIITLRWDQVQEHVINFRDPKTRKKVEVEITPELRALLSECKSLSKNSEFVVNKRKGRAGQRYTSEGFRAVWQRLMAKWVRMGNDRITFHHIRDAAERRFRERQARKTELASAIADYPQFESSVRDEAAVMAEYYQVFYCLEQMIRKLVVTRLEAAEGLDWWNSGRVPVDAQNAAVRLRQREEDSGITPRSSSMIDYVTFGELSGIITSNWDIFEPAFTNKAAVPRILHSLNLLRGPIAHSCVMSADEIHRLGIGIRDWFRHVKV